MTRVQRLILAVAAILVATCGNPVSHIAGGDLEPNAQIPDRMYWTATMNRWERGDAGSMRGHWGLAFSSPHAYIVKTAKLWFHEEQSNGVRRIVMDKGEWDWSISDLYYQFPDGGRAPGGPNAFKSGKLDVNQFSAIIDYRIDKSTGKKIVHVSFGVEAEDPEVKYQYFPMKIGENRDDTTRPDTKLKDRAFRMQREGQNFAASYTDDNNITLRSHVGSSNRGETWIVRGTGKAETPELVLEPLAYDDWWPAGDRDEHTPGNAIAVKATLKGPGDSPPRVPAKRIRFELVRVSQEPGVSLNWPPADQFAATPLPDFKIDPDRNGDLSVTANGQKARTPDGEHFEATVVISAYDWGAFGRLRAVADLTTGGTVVGHLKGDPGRTEVLLPKRQEDSRIADPWKKHTDAEYLADDSDGEDDPVGNGFEGDGLSLYEEYRGFHEKGEHIGGNPKKKDLFVRDEINTPFSKQGITLFQTVSGINVHHRLRESELSGAAGSNKERVINLNFRSAHLVDQHALLIKAGDPGHRGGHAIGGPGVPRSIKFLLIHPLESRFFRDYNVATILAHEMLHGVNVRHHGEKDNQINRGVRDDGFVYWRLGEDRGIPCINEYQLDDSGNPVPSTARRVTVYRGIGTSREVVAPERFRLGMKLWVAANQGGQHSGDKKCLMAYDIASAVAGPQLSEFQERNLGRQRTLVRAPPRATRLCDSPNGTSFFGDADSNAEVLRQRGNCTKQICVNDKYQGP
ncbi:MAG: hypothetical protein WD648_08570 [Planctomycetaceae bacterium]